MKRTSGFNSLALFLYYFVMKALREFSIVINVTPTSANTANHIVVIPHTLQIKNNNFMVRITHIF